LTQCALKADKDEGQGGIVIFTVPPVAVVTGDDVALTLFMGLYAVEGVYLPGRGEGEDEDDDEDGEDEEEASLFCSIIIPIILPTVLLRLLI
jgi:hypothetical protein